jgi:glycyl-tRNA synthetase alpha chain
VKYGEVFRQNEVEMSEYAFNAADTDMLFATFDAYEKECKRLIQKDLALPAYECALKCSHVFNLLHARGAISVTERASFIQRVRDNARTCAESFLKQRARLGYPLLRTAWTVGEQPEILEGKAASEYWKSLTLGEGEAAPRG